MKWLLILLYSLSTFASAATELTWYGHSAFKIVTPAGKVLFVDPWITNPANKEGKDELAKIDHADLILVSHGHFDHVGDSVEIAKKTKARLVTTFDLGQALVKFGGFPKEQAGFDSLGNFGGELSFFDGEVKIDLVPAVHSSSVTGADGEPHFGGNPGGFVIKVKQGPTIYHTGDTDLFSDMKLLRQYGKIDVMLACIGGHFTMGPKRAALAVKLVDPRVVVPMHFGTFPVLDGTPAEFAQALGKDGRKMRTMKVGETISF